MTREDEVLYFKMHLLQAEIEMQAMIVTNKQRESEGKAFAYTEADFFNLIDKYSIHDNAFPYYKGE